MSPVEDGSIPVSFGDSFLAMWISLLHNFQQKTQVWIHVVFLCSSRHFTQEMLVVLGSSVERRWWLETPHHSVPGPRGEVKYVLLDRSNVDVICSPGGGGAAVGGGAEQGAGAEEG